MAEMPQTPRTPQTPADPDSGGQARWREVARVFTVIGFIGFGGPAAHVALMREQLVARRGWIDDREFLDLNSACNLVPGPNSTELAIHLGLQRAGWRGFVAAACGFILPAVAIVLVIAWAYDRYGTTPTATSLSVGIVPVIVAVVAHATYSLGRAALRGPVLAALGLASTAAWLAGVNELIIMVSAATLHVLVRQATALRRTNSLVLLPLLAPLTSSPAASDPELWRLAGVFLKIGAVLYGSGYVLVSFLERDLVQGLGWLTERQLLDAVAVGQVTPGPVFTTATFVGYQVAGLPGAIVATVAIFAPAFVFVALLSRVTPLMRRSPVAGAALDGVNAASVGLMAGAAIRLGDTALTSPLTWALGAGALIALVTKRLSSTWLVAIGAAAGLAQGWW